MKRLAVSALLVVLIAAPAAPAHAGGDLPLTVPAGWESQRQDGGLLIKPKGLGGGKFYTVAVLALTRKLGSVRALLDAGKASLGEVGTFKPATEPARGKNEHGWEFDVVIGPLEKDGKALLAQAMGLKRGDDEGVIIVIADSVETLTKYSDDFTAMNKGLGASASVASAPIASAPVAPAGGAVDLRYRVPDGWSSKPVEGGVVLEKTENTLYDKYTFRILILPSEPLVDGLRQTFLANWTAKVVPALETQIAPLPFMRRLGSGVAVAYDTDARAKTKNGGQTVDGGVYVVAFGKRYVPIMVFFFGGVLGGKLETDLTGLLESASLPGAGDGRVAMFSAADLPGEWSTSSASYANYVTASGAYAGDASIATASYLTLRADGSFKRSFQGVSSSRVIREADAGSWKLDDMLLVQNGKSVASTWILGVGADPKAGAFLVLGRYSNTEDKASFCNPRGAFQGEWYKRKD